MRKMTLALACSVLILSAGCQPTEQKLPDNPLPSSAPLETEQPQIPRLLNVDFAELEESVYEATGTQKAALPCMYDTNPIDIFFLPDGKVVQLNACLWTFDTTVGGDYVMSEHQVCVDSAAHFGIQCTKEKQHFSRELFDFDFDGLKNFTAWIDGADLQTLLNDYVPGTPAGYRLVLGNIPAEIVDCPEVSWQALDLSAETPRKVNTNCLHRASDSYYLEFGIDAQYCALLPYYSAEDAPGCQVPLSQPLVESLDYAAPDGGEHVLNNILLLFPAGPAAQS